MKTLMNRRSFQRLLILLFVFNSPTIAPAQLTLTDQGTLTRDLQTLSQGWDQAAANEANCMFANLIMRSVTGDSGAESGNAG